MSHPELADEQAYVDDAYRCLAAMRERTARAPTSASPRPRRSTPPSPRRTCATGCATLDADVPGLSFGRLDDDGDDTWYVGRRHVEDARGDAGGRRLAGAGVHALLPGHRGRPAGPAATPAVRDDRPAASTTCSTRSSTTPTASTPPTTAASPTRCSPSWSGPARARCATSSPPSPAEQDVVIRAPLDTLPGGAGRARHRQDRGRPAPGRLPALRAPAPARRATACWSSGPTRSSCATSPRSCRRWARPPSGRPPSTACWPARRTGCGRRPRRGRRGSRATPAWRRCSPGRWRAPSAARDDDVDVSTAWGTARVARPAIDEVGSSVRDRGVPHNVGRATFRTPDGAAGAVRPAAAAQRRGGDHRGRRCRPAGQPRLVACPRPPVAPAQRTGARPPAAHQPHGAGGGRGRRDGGRRAGGDPPRSGAPRGRRAVDRRRPGAARRGRGGHQRPAPRLRPRRGRRGPGPVGHGAASAGPPQPGPRR